MRQGWGVTGGWGQGPWWEELFSQQLEWVRRVLPLARFPMGGLQAWSTHLETDTKGDGGSVRVLSYSRVYYITQVSAFWWQRGIQKRTSTFQL